MDLNSPSVNVQIDRDKAASLGVSPSAIETALGSAFGGQQVSTMYGTSNQYWVMLELLPQYQNDAMDLNRLYITPGGAQPSSITPSGSSTPGDTGMTPLVPLSAVTTLAPSVMPLSINHLGQLPAVTISFNLAPGYALSDATRTIGNVQRKLNLPSGIQGTFQGTAQAFQSSLSNIGVLLAIAILTVYIILGILYESFVHPLTILSGLPSAAMGALITLMLFGVPLSLYGFVGMIMLIGIVKKNAIMMIDFALHREREEGVEPDVAIVEAALIRFRPIMMTTMAALMGTLPVAIGFGAGSEARRPLGLAVVGGLFVSQLLTLYITPVIYVYLDRLGSRLYHGKAPMPARLQPNSVALRAEWLQTFALSRFTSATSSGVSSQLAALTFCSICSGRVAPAMTLARQSCESSHAKASSSSVRPRTSQNPRRRPTMVQFSSFM